MTDRNEHEDAERDDDVIAAEYVLGVLPGEERAGVARRLETDRHFAKLVSAWEERLSGLNANYEEVAPPARLWRDVEARLFPEASSVHRARGGLWQSLAFWRAVSLSAVTAAAILGVVVLNRPTAPVPGPQQVAVLAAAEDSTASFLALREADGTVRITRTGASAPTDRVYELWAIAGEDVPVSLGLLGDEEVTRTALPGDLATLPERAITLAVTVEPPGGAPSGLQHGPVVAIGPLKKI